MDFTENQLAEISLLRLLHLLPTKCNASKVEMKFDSVIFEEITHSLHECGHAKHVLSRIVELDGLHAMVEGVAA
ncbi:hypothetical protein [Vibrio crassostreae]|uniref:hypothetical protein n=1 Tax=Vibrio crassostreae TaxID=246167 RepID=UPI001B313B81|nr:hypothetical protein [Vibrio crassostreae]